VEVLLNKLLPSKKLGGIIVYNLGWLGKPQIKLKDYFPKRVSTSALKGQENPNLKLGYKEFCFNRFC